MIGLDNTYSGVAMDNWLLQENTVSRKNITEELDNVFGETNELVPFDGYICINYDSNYVDGENVTAPTSLWNFTEEAWKGKVFPSAVPTREEHLCLRQLIISKTKQNGLWP